ncbi:DsrE family protein [Planctomycetes bacterium K23_9]|uniref:DsrE/DsrF-like family protein n=1 Tax=Stieleria marina TaxID=1930275 RepID=A0A517NZX2_9BACT|nr:DsrE/DsrF-like family protein [Planctomycetes bacterium K23_9]
MRQCISIVATFALLLAALPAQAEDHKQAPKAQQVVVHLSHFTDDLHRCFMALKVAGLMQTHGAEVSIFLDLEGVRLAQRRQELAFTWGADSPTLAEYYDKFTAAGGKVVVCPHCAKSAHVSQGGLRRNAEIATMPALGKLLVDADKVMDY